MYELTVIIPTLNEAKVIRQTVNTVVETLEKEMIFGQVLVVDDNSQDGSLEILKDLKATYQNFEYLIRTSDPGLSQATYDGIFAAESDVVLVMDADGQHPIDKIPVMYQEICNDHDIVIGSRYMKGGEIQQWGLTRRLISAGATQLARLFFPDIKDPVSGFFAFKRSVVDGSVLHPRGYKISLEVLGKGQWKSVKEIPISFGLRTRGESKLRKETIIEYLKQLADLIWYSVNHRDSPAYAELKQAIKFMLVGVIGIFVNLGTLIILTEYLSVHPTFSIWFAIEVAILSNFLFNDLWSFRGFDKQFGFLNRAFRYNAVCIGGMIINLIVYYSLLVFAVNYVLADLIGIFCGYVWNYIVNRRVTWSQN